MTLQMFKNSNITASFGSALEEPDLWIELVFLCSPCKQIEENTNQEIKIKIPSDKKKVSCRPPTQTAGCWKPLSTKCTLAEISSGRSSDMLSAEFLLLLLRLNHSDYLISCCLSMSHAADERALSLCYCLSLFPWMYLFVLITSLEFGSLSPAGLNGMSKSVF